VKPGIFDRVRTSVRRRAEMYGDHTRASSVEITRTSLVSQQTLDSGHMFTGTSLRI
jgi:hypothetical protein